MPVIHSRLTDGELHSFTNNYKKDMSAYPSYMMSSKSIKSDIDQYSVTVFDIDFNYYKVYLFDKDGYVLGLYNGYGRTMIESVQKVVEDHERVYRSQRNEFNRWDGDLTKL